MKTSDELLGKGGLISVQTPKKWMTIYWKTRLAPTTERQLLWMDTFLTKYSKSIEEQYSEKKNYLKILLWKKKSTPASNVSTEWYMNACVTSTKDWEWTQSPFAMGLKIIWIRIQLFLLSKMSHELSTTWQGTPQIDR